MMKPRKNYLVFDHKQIVNSFYNKEELDKWLAEMAEYHAKNSSSIYAYYVVEALEYEM